MPSAFSLIREHSSCSLVRTSQLCKDPEGEYPRDKHSKCKGSGAGMRSEHWQSSKKPEGWGEWVRGEQQEVVLKERAGQGPAGLRPGRQKELCQYSGKSREGPSRRVL